MTVLLRTLAALALAILATVPVAAAPASPVGQWEVTTGEARYKVSSCGDAKALLCVKLVWLRPDQRTEENLALLNTYLVRGAAAVETNKWSGDVVVDGREYAGTMTMVSKNFMKLRGCSGILCQTYEFTRI